MRLCLRAFVLLAIPALLTTNTEATTGYSGGLDAFAQNKPTTIETDKSCNDIFESYLENVILPLLKLPVLPALFLLCRPDPSGKKISFEPQVMVTTLIAGDKATLNSALSIVQLPIEGTSIPILWVKNYLTKVDILALKRDPSQGDFLNDNVRATFRYQHLGAYLERILQFANYTSNQSPNTFRKTYEEWFGKDYADAAVKDLFPISNYFSIRFDTTLILEDDQLMRAFGIHSLSINRDCMETSTGYCDADLPDSKSRPDMICPEYPVPSGASALVACYYLSETTKNLQPILFVKTAEGRMTRLQ